MRAAAVTLGILGAGDDSLSTVCESIARQKRLHLAELYDSSLARAERLAGENSVAYAPSLRRMFRRVEGIVSLRPGWQGVESLLAAVSAQKSLLLLRTTLQDLSNQHFLCLREAARTAGTLILPQLRHRWARSTLRLRELTATRLGAIENLGVICHAPAEGLPLLEIIDYCREVMQSDFRSVEALGERDMFRLTFRRIGKEGAPVAAEVQLVPSHASSEPEVLTHAICRHGEARLTGDSQLQWQTGRLNEKESLQVERSALDVMFDLFGRRLVGGVVPVPDLSDLLRASQVSAALSLSRARREPVDIPQAE